MKNNYALLWVISYHEKLQQASFYEYHFTDTDIPAYSDTGYSDTPLIVTLWAGPKSFINRLYGYSDTNICFQWHFWRQFELKNH